MTKEQIEQFLASDEAKAVFTLAAYAIKKTKTQKDDAILEDINEYATLIASKIKEIADQEPTDKDAKEAGVAILKKIASMTETKWDDFVVNLLDKVV